MIVLVAGSFALIANPDFLRWKNQLGTQELDQLTSRLYDVHGNDLDNQLENDLINQLPGFPENQMGDLKDVRFLLWTRYEQGRLWYLFYVPRKLASIFSIQVGRTAIASHAREMALLKSIHY